MSELKGVIIVKEDTKTFGDKGFKKREIVIETKDDKYPQTILIELIQDKCALVDDLNVGDSISVSYNINGRKWINPEGVAKYFNSIQGWRIEKVEDNAESDYAPPPVVNNEPQDLPF